MRERARAARERADKAKARAAASPATVSATDPDSRIVLRKGGGWIQGYNFQLGTLRRQITAYAGIHDSPCDKEALVPGVRGAAANAAAAGISTWDPQTLADCGYASAASFHQLADINLLVSVRRETATTGLDDDAPAARAAWQDMATRFTQPSAKDTYKQRGALVEPGFAQFFARFGRTITRRGTQAADAEIHLLATAFNISKLITARQRRPPALPQPA
ncbi:MAG TPA: transposase [Streptosporangiaceae bacterium]